MTTTSLRKAIDIIETGYAHVCKEDIDKFIAICEAAGIAIHGGALTIEGGELSGKWFYTETL